MKSAHISSAAVIPAGRQCPRCGAPLGGFGPEGLCGACLLGSGLAAEDAASDPDPPAAGLRRFGDYELLGEIARGGMGVVYRARQVGLDRVVALKMILGGQVAGPEEVKRFRQEAGAAAQLKHPNIVAIHEVGERDGQPFFSMDFIEGQTLRQLTRDNPLSAQRAAACLKTVAEAVHYAHEQGVVHRDLKPSNVLIDANDQPHITDFGLAKRLDSEADLTASGAAMGTPGYMPPEQAGGQTRSVSPLADGYALGAMLYDLLTGRPPFRGETPAETMAQVLNKEPVAPRLLNAAVPRDLETICLKCLEKEPSRRYASAQELALDLGRFLNHEPVLAQPPNAIYRARKFVRRHRLGVAVAAGMALLLTGATVISITFGLRALKAKELAKTSAEDSQAVLMFFRVSVLAAPRPAGERGGLGVNVTIRDAVDAAEPYVEAEFANRPLVAAAIRDSLGTTYYQLGEYDASIRQFGQALALRRKHQGAHAAETLDTLHELARAYSGAGNYAQSTNCFQEVIEQHKAMQGINHIKTLVTMQALTVAHLDAGNSAEALRTAEDVLRRCRDSFGAGHKQTLSAMVNLADAYLQTGQENKAIALNEEALNLYRALLGPTNHSTITALNNLAVTFGKTSVGRFTEAIDMLQEVLKSESLTLPPDHPLLLTKMHNLAVMHSRAGQFDEALRMLDRALSAAQSTNRANDPITFRIMGSKAVALRNLGRVEEAVALAEQVLHLTRTSQGADHPDTLTSLNNLAVAYLSSGQWSKAMPLLQDALTRFKPTHTADNELLAIMENLMVAHRDAGHTNEAEHLQKQIAERLAARPSRSRGSSVEPPDQRNRIESAKALAMQTAGTNSPADPERMLRDKLATQRKTLPTNSMALAATLTLLSEHMLKRGDYTNAEPLLHESLGIYEKQQPGLSPVFNVKSLLGWSFLGQKRYPEGERYLNEAYEGLTQRQSERPSASRAQPLKTTAERLAQLYTAWGKPEEAAKWREKVKGSLLE